MMVAQSAYASDKDAGPVKAKAEKTAPHKTRRRHRR